MTTQLDKDGLWQPAKLFPCDCGTEGVMVVVEEDSEFFDCEGAPFLGMGFWECRASLDSRVGLTKWERIKYAWHILKGGSPWTDMVWMRAETAKKLANHILYLLNKVRKSDSPSRPLFDWPKNVKIQEDKLV